MKTFRLLNLALGLSLASAAQASGNPTMDADVAAINNGWARIKYQVKGSSAQYAQLEALAAQAAAVSAKYPNQAEPLLWQGIVRSEEAAVASTFKKLGLATTARDLLLKAYSLNPHVANGGVPMSLGVLYYKVPGWPVGFGSPDRAGKLLKAALSADPDGLDANFFYGDYLISQGKNVLAKPYLQKALNAPHDASRPVWDAGRRGEVRALLAKAS